MYSNNIGLDTLINRQFGKINIIKSLLFILFISNSGLCQISELNNSDDNQKCLTIFFVDISGSFNRSRSLEPDEYINYFELACDEIRRFVEDDLKVGRDVVYVKKIESNSFNDNTLIAKIDLASDIYIYKESVPDTKNDLKINNYNKRKNAFDVRSRQIAHHEIQNVSQKIQSFKYKYENNPSNFTDIIDALNSIKIDFNNKYFSAYDKRIIIYSDFKETKKSITDTLTIDLSDYYIEGRYVSKDDYDSPNAYLKNIELWRNIFKCKSLDFYTPENSSYRR